MRNHGDVIGTTREQNNEPLPASIASSKHHRMVMKNKWYTGVICKHLNSFHDWSSMNNFLI